MSTIAQTRTNLALNPAAVGTSNWISVTGTGGAVTLTNTATGGPNTAGFNTVKWTTGTTSPGGGIGAILGTLTPGTQYTGSIWVRSSRAQTVQVFLKWYNGGSWISNSWSTNISLSANTWTRVSATATSPANTNTGQITVEANGAGTNWAVNDTFDGQAVLFEAVATVGTYFDGSTSPSPGPAGYNPPATWQYAWTGSGNGSASTASLVVPLQIFQTQFPDGTVLGAGTDVNVQAIRGLRSLLGVRAGDQPRAQADGTYPGFNLLGSRLVQIDWRIIRPSGTTEQALAKLTAEWQNIIDPSTVVLRAGDYLRQQAGIGAALPVASLQIQLPNRAYPLLVFGRPTKLDLPVDTSFQWGDVTVPTEFTCTDGLVYDANVASASTGLPNPTSGLTFNATPNFAFGASTGGSFTLNNTGLYQTAPFFVIQGPCTNPTITLQATAQKIRLNITLGAADKLAVDCQNGAVTLNGTANRNNIVDPTSTFFQLPAGSSTIQFASTDSTSVAGTLTGYILPAYSTV